ncbi:MAG: hypothetical protein BJ554DRAFT_8119, partial [Olpidium bornovanus]
PGPVFGRPSPAVEPRDDAGLRGVLGLLLPRCRRVQQGFLGRDDRVRRGRAGRDVGAPGGPVRRRIFPHAVGGARRALAPGLPLPAGRRPRGPHRGRGRPDRGRRRRGRAGARGPARAVRNHGRRTDRVVEEGQRRDMVPASRGGDRVPLHGAGDARRRSPAPIVVRRVGVRAAPVVRVRGPGRVVSGGAGGRPEVVRAERGERAGRDAGLGADRVGEQVAAAGAARFQGKAGSEREKRKKERKE